MTNPNNIVTKSKIYYIPLGLIRIQLMVLLVKWNFLKKGQMILSIIHQKKFLKNLNIIWAKQLFLMRHTQTGKHLQ